MTNTAQKIQADSVWVESAKALIAKHGYVEALRRSMEWRSHSSEGTATFAFHNATAKAIRLLGVNHE